MFVITVKRYNREAKMTFMTLNLKKEKQGLVFFFNLNLNNDLRNDTKTLENCLNRTFFVRYNRELGFFVRYSHEILLVNYAKPNQEIDIVRYNREFVITVIVITEFDCSLFGFTFYWFTKGDPNGILRLAKTFFCLCVFVYVFYECVSVVGWSSIVLE
jgi:hypothetical protein